MPGPAPTAGHGDDARYRRGCRCTGCRIAHAVESTRWRHERRYGDGAPMGPEVRSRILTSLLTTRSVIVTAKAVGVTHQAIYAACVALPQFGEQVDELTRAEE